MNRHTKGDVVGVLEAAYALGVGDDAWLEGVLHAATPLLDRGLGVLAYEYDASNEGPMRIWSPRFAGGSEEQAQQAFRGLAGGIAALTPRQVHAAFFEYGPVKTLSDIFGQRPDHTPNIKTHIVATGAPDFLILMAQDPSRCGCVVAAGRAKPSRAGRSDVRRWARVAAHMAAGYRLRRAAARGEEAAVLGPDGRVLHAEGPARAKNAQEALRAAAKRIDRARSRARGDPEEALALWQGLIAGRWSLVDRFDSDGRRYIVARENDPRTPDPRALSLRERQVLAYSALGHPLKLTAYELGLSTSSVWRYRSTGMRKLGLASLAEVIPLFSTVAKGDDAPNPSGSRR